MDVITRRADTEIRCNDRGMGGSATVSKRICHPGALHGITAIHRAPIKAKVLAHIRR